MSKKDIRFSPGVKEDLLNFPKQTRVEVGHKLWRVEEGEIPEGVSQFDGIKSNKVLKIVERHDTDTYRVVFTVEFEKAILDLTRLQEEIYVWNRHATKRRKDSGETT